jgi:hypothetical protein
MEKEVAKKSKRKKRKEREDMRVKRVINSLTTTKKTTQR